MNHLSIFDSRDPLCKQPYGAVAGGTTVKLCLRPPRNLGFTSAKCTAIYESRNNHTVTLTMHWEGMELGRDLFRCELPTDGYLGLIWYSFLLTGPDGRREEIPTHQLTVYDGSISVPDWYGQGVGYQIFPDRFRRSRIPDPTGMVGGRSVHQEWSEEPVWKPNHSGEVRNRDFFGGDFKGVLEKLDYLKGLGVDTIYFNPIFEAAENHRYGTADYDRIDPMLGTNEDFVRLCDEAHARGMHIMLDGVFNHAGFVSRYFNGDGFYPDLGAYQSEDSPYRPWFAFKNWPREYESWWGIYSLPAVNEHNEDYRNFIFAGENSVVRRWLRSGADAWRLDVADELPDDFVHGIHAAARAEKPSAVIIGEVWEDGSNKIAYNTRRKHVLGGHCDGLMNYPLRNAILRFFQQGDGAGFVEQMETIRENYPPFDFYSAMNSLGTHDTPRILTLLGAGGEYRDQSKQWRAEFKLSPRQKRKGKDLLKAASLLLFAFPGSPTVYYGDEIGMEGFEDPFNRRTFPWGKEDSELLDWYRALGQLRHDHTALRRGGIRYVAGEENLLAFLRRDEREEVLLCFNASDEPRKLTLDFFADLQPILGSANVTATEDEVSIMVRPRSGSAVLVHPVKE